MREQFQSLQNPGFQESLLNSTWSKMPPEYAVGKPTGFCQVWKSDNVDQGSITDQQHPDNHRSPLIPSLAMNQAGAQVLILGFKDDGGCGFQPSFSDCLIRAF